jgi:hypothetical protein
MSEILESRGEQFLKTLIQTSRFGSNPQQLDYYDYLPKITHRVGFLIQMFSLSSRNISSFTSENFRVFLLHTNIYAMTKHCRLDWQGEKNKKIRNISKTANINPSTWHQVQQFQKNAEHNSLSTSYLHENMKVRLTVVTLSYYIWLLLTSNSSVI